MESPALKWLLLQQRLALAPSQLRVLMDLAADPQQLVDLPQSQVEHFVSARFGEGGWAEQLLDTPLRKRVAKLLADAEALPALADSLGDIELLCRVDADYPALLNEITDPPPLLFMRGQRGLLQRPMLAVVGSRRPSRRGEQDAQAFAHSLAEAGLTVVSGLALGVDGAAHRGALEGAAGSVAVLGCGVDVCYPRANRHLYEALLEGGLLISEYGPGSAPLRHQFPRRNRIISGLSLGVLVVEAAIKSGSLITARQALEQNREVFALPGSIHNPASRGCNALIRQGAKLVETLGDIFEELPLFENGGTAAPNLAAPDKPEPGLLALLEFAPLSLDELARRSGLPLTDLLSALAELEIAGWIEHRDGAWQRSR